MKVEPEKIREAKEALGDRNAELIVEELGIQDFDERNKKCCCPFHNEDHASFVYNHKEFNFHCFGACGRSWDLIDVLMYKGMTYLQACERLFELAEIPYSFGEKGVQTRRQYRYPHEEPADGDKSAVYAYFATRKISQKTVDYLDIRQDFQGNIVWNYYDSNDVLTMVKYRPSRKVRKGENKCWCQKNSDTSPILFNMNRINVGEPLLICEGEPDAASAVESGFYNVVSVPLGSANFHWVEECWEWLEQFSEIIICSDNDEAGVKMQKELVPRLGSWRTKTIDIPKFCMYKGKKRPTKDLNEILYYCGKQAVLDLIMNAQDSPIQSVVDFADIEDVDLGELDGITTGIKDLDRYFMKLFMGTFNIVTGINGAGKSSFLDQIIGNAIEQGRKVWLYSGELPNHQVKNWMNGIFAGQRNIEEKKFGESVYYKTRPDAIRGINEWIRGQLYIYKDGEPNGKEDLFQCMEAVVRQYGVKLLVLDNLSVINLECSTDNLNTEQKNLVQRLIKFAVTYNVVIILVVHPHKIETMRRLTKMDVQGTGAITDLAHRAVSLYRVQDEEKKGVMKQNGSGWLRPPVKADVLVDVLKDRMTGYEGRSFGLYYDRPSRRFFNTEEDLDHRFPWDEKTYTGGLPFPPPQLAEDPEEEEVFGKI